MMLIVLLCLSMGAGAINIPNCDGIVVDGIFYHSEDLTTIMEKPSMLALDHKLNTIYFCHNSTLTPTKLDLDTFELAVLKGFNSEVTALAVDSESHDLYLGENGIYKVNYFENVAKPYALSGFDIISLLYDKGIVYALRFPTYEVYTVSNGHYRILEELKGTVVEKFVIDKNNIVYYSNTTGLYSQKLGKSRVENAKTVFKSNEKEIRAMTTDYFGNIFISLSNGIYELNTETSTLHLMYPTENAYDIAVDINGNLIFSNLRRLIKVRINLLRNCGKYNYNKKPYIEKEEMQTDTPSQPVINIKKYNFETIPTAAFFRKGRYSQDDREIEITHPNVHRIFNNFKAPQASRIKYPRQAMPSDAFSNASAKTVSEMLRQVQMKLIEISNILEDLSSIMEEFI